MLREIPFISRTTPLPIFVHGNKYLKNLLNFYWVNLVLNSFIEYLRENHRRPFLIVDRNSLVDLDLSDLRCKILPLGDQPNYLGVNLIYPRM